MPFPAIIISIGSSLVGLLASKSVETAAEPILSKLKDKLEKLFGLGKYEAIRRALEGAREDILLKIYASSDRVFASQILDYLLEAPPTPFVDDFAKQISQNYLFPLSPEHTPEHLAEDFRRMIASSSTVQIGGSDDTSITNVLSNFFLFFRERLLKEEDFAYLREYYELREIRLQTDLQRQQTGLQEQMLDQLTTIATNTSKPVEDFDSIRKEYFNYLARNLEAHTIRGFSPQVGGGNVISLPLSRIFVPLKAVEGRPPLAEYAEEDLLRQAVGEMNSESEGGLDWELRTLALERRLAQLKIGQEAEKSLTLADLLQSSRAILLGHPGTGKTTITRYVTYSLAVNDLRHIGIDLAGRVPVLIRIANFAKACEQDSTLHIIEYVAKEMTDRPEFGNFLRWAIGQNLCFVILDGLDEISDTSLRIRVTDHIQNMVASFSGNHYLVTSRIVGYDQSPLTQEFQHATLQELTDEDKNRFVQLWYDAMQSKIGSETHGKGADDLIIALRNKPPISRMAANPLLLTIMVLMHWRGTKLPSRRVQVYQTATDTLVEYWTIQREGVDLDAEEIKNILAPIAHYILSSNVSGVIAHQDLLPRFYEGIVLERGCSQEDARRIGREMLKDLNEQSGLFLERGVDANNQPVFGFLHQTFGEYLAALHLAHNIQEDCFKLEDYIHQSIWHEPLLLLLGHLSLYNRPQANSLMRRIINYPALYEETLQRNLLLAADCLGDDIQIEPNLRDEVLEKLAKLIQHPVSQIRDEAIERYQSIAATRHREVAVASLKSCYRFDDSDKLNKLPKSTRFDLAKALISLREHESAQPIVWQLDEDNYGNRVRRLRFEHWPELATDYLLQLQADNEYDFSVSAGKDLSSSTLGPVDAALAQRVLGEKKIIALVEQLLDRMKNDNDKATLRWIAILAAENPSYESLLTLTHDEIPAKIRSLIAKRLLKSEHRVNAVSVLKNLASDTPEEANTAAEAFLEVGDKDYVDTQSLRYSAVHDFNRNSAEAIINLFKLGDMEFCSPAVLYYFARNGRNWEVVKSLFSNDLNDIGLAAAELLALWPGYSNRWEACEALIKAGYVEKVILLMQFLAIECHDKASNQAIQKLIMLEEGEGIKPLLYSMARSTTAYERYQASLALAKVDSRLLSENMDVPERIELKTKIQEERIDAFKAAIQNFCQVGKRVLTELNTTDEQVGGVRDLAYYELARFASLHNVSVDIPKVELIELLKSNLPLVRLRAGLYAVEEGLLDQTNQISIELLSNSKQDASLQVQLLASILRCRLLNIVNEQPAELHKLLTNPHAPVRRRIAIALGLIGQPGSVAALVSALDDQDKKTRVWVADSLGYLRNAEATLSLIGLLDDKESNVRRAALWALGKLGNMSVTPHVMRMLADDDNKIRRTASFALWFLGDLAAIPKLVTALQDDDYGVRVNSALTLGELRDSSAVQSLIAALKDVDKQVRRSVTYVLGNLGDRSAVPNLIDSLNDKNLEVRYNAAIASGKLNAPAAVEPLNSALIDEKEKVRRGALRALKQLNAPINVQAVITLLKDKAPEKRWAAAHILALLNLNISYEFITSLLNDENATVRSWVNWSLGQLGNSDAIPFLQNSLNDEDANVRRAASESLGRLGDSSVVPKLVAMLGDNESIVRSWASWALGQIGDGLAAPQLIALLNDDDKKVRENAARSLGQLHVSKAVESLILALNDPSRDVSSAAANSLSRIGDPIAVPHLKQALIFPERFMALARMKVSDIVPRIMFTFGNFDETGDKKNSFSLVHLNPIAALTYLERCERRYPKKGWVAYLRGQALWKQEDIKSTMDSFYEALNIVSFERENTEIILALVHSYLEQDELQRAFEYAERAVLYSPNSDICLLTYAVTLWIKGDAEMAWEQLKKAKIQNRHIINADDLQFEYFWREKALFALKGLKASEFV